MEIIKLHPTTYTDGKIVNGIDKKLWVERYREPGEFEFTGKASTLHAELPIGSLISHVDTKSVMMVETHEIEETDDDNGDPDIVISGRTLDFFLEYRVADIWNAGTTRLATGGVSPTPESTYVYNLPTAVTWLQLVSLLEEQLLATTTGWNSMIDIPNIAITYNFGGGEAVTDKDAKIGSLAKAAGDLMDFANLGIIIERPDTSHSTLNFVITKGFDKTTTVQFDWNLGDISNAKYLWTTKGYYNGIRVRGKYAAATVYPSGKTGFDVRMRMIDEETIDDSPEFMSGGQLTVLTNRLKAFGQAELNRQNQKTITNAVISPSNRFV